MELLTEPVVEQTVETTETQKRKREESSDTGPKITTLQIRTYQEVQLDHLSLDVRSMREKHKQPIVSIVDACNKRISFALFAETDKRSVLPFGVDVTGPYAPQALGGTAPQGGARRVEGVKPLMSVNETQARFLEAFEEWVQVQVTKKSQEIFGQQLQSFQTQTLFSGQKSLKPTGPFEPKIAVKVNLLCERGLEWRLTRFVVREKETGEEFQAQGWTQLEPLHAKYGGFKNAEARAVVRPEIWTLPSKSFGVSMFCTDLLLFVSKQEGQLAVFSDPASRPQYL